MFRPDYERGFNRMYYSNKRNELEREHNLMKKFILWFIGIVFVLMVLYYFIFGFILVKSYNYIDKHGLKGVIERIWEGNENK